MKIKLWEIISYCVLIFLTIAFGLLRSVWSGFSYFGSVTLVLLLIMFIISRFIYLADLKKEYDSNLNIYFAELLNNGIINKKQFDAKDEKYVKLYYKDYKKTSKVQITIVVVTTLVILSVILLILGVF